MRAKAPQATRAVVSRAEARSSTSRRSLLRYFMPPERSAWPGRGEWMRRWAAMWGSASHGAMIVSQLSQSRLRIHRATGEPRVVAVPYAADDPGLVALDHHAPAAAVAVLAPGEIPGDHRAVDREAGGQAGEDGGQPGAVALPGGGELEALEHGRQVYNRSRTLGARPEAAAVAGSRR